MAYSRWSENSQVYVYADASFGGLTCCACVTGYTVDQMVEHLEWHKREGHKVPGDLISSILANRENIDAYPPKAMEEILTEITRGNE